MRFAQSGWFPPQQAKCGLPPHKANNAPCGDPGLAGDPGFDSRRNGASLTMTSRGAVIVARRTLSRGASFMECGEVELEQIADAIDGDIGGREAGDEFGVESVMALSWKDGGDLAAPDALHRGEDTDLIVDEHVVIGREALLHVGEFLFLVDIDQRLAFDGFPDS
jgi:hypothetical protein